MVLQKERYYKRLRLIGIAAAIISALFFVGLDVRAIVMWYARFDECLIKGDLFEYTKYIEESTYISNYSIISNIAGGIWLFPIYCITALLKYGTIIIDVLEMPRNIVVIWYTWHKILILIITFLSLNVFHKILKKLNFGSHIYVCDMLYLTTPLVFIASLGNGQVDCFSVLFMLYGINAFLDKKYFKTSFMMSLTLLYKGMPIIVYVPVMALILFTKLNFKKLFQHVLILISMPAINFLLEKFIFVGYNEMRSDHQSSLNFFDRLTMGDGYICWFLLIAVLICVPAFYISSKGDVKKEYYLIFPLAMLTAFSIFVVWNPQWMLMLVPFIIIAGCYLDFSPSYLLCFLFISIGFAIAVPMMNNSMGYDDNGMLYDSLLWFVFKCFPTHFMDEKLNEISPYMATFGYTLLKAGIIGILLLVIFNYLNKFKAEQTSSVLSLSYNKVKKLLLSFQWVPSFLFFIACLALIPANYVENWWNIKDGDNIFQISDSHFFSMFPQDENSSYISDGEGCLIYGPYKEIPEGIYSIKVLFEYSGEVPENGIVGYVTVNSNKGIIDHLEYVTYFNYDDKEVEINDLAITEYCDDFEIQVSANYAGLKVDTIVVTKKE